MAEEFKVLIGTELDTVSIDSLKQQISGIKTNPVKIKIDTSDVISEINKIKNQIQNLNNVNINFSSVRLNNGTHQIDSYANSLQKSYRNLYSLSKQISNMELKVGKLNMSGINKNEISGYITELNKLKQIYATLETQLNNGVNINFTSLTSSIEQAKTKISELSAKVDDAKTKLASNIKLKIDNGTLNNQLSSIESKFQKLGVESNEVSNQIQKLKSLLGNMDASDDIESLISDYQNFQQILKTTENNVKVLQRVQSEHITTVNKTTSSFGNLAKQVASYFSAYQMINYSIRAMKDMCQNVLDVDTAMTELYRITDLTSQQYDDLYSKMTSSAKKYGSSLSEIINSTADWVRLGFNSDSAVRLSEITTMYQHVTDLDNSTAVDNLVTAYKGFQDQLLELTNNDEAAAVELIADIYDKLGNEFALSAADVGSGLSKAASTLQMAGNSIQESVAMITGITEVTQDPDKAGNALKILSLRLRGMKGELEELGEDVDENVESLSKMQTQVLNLSHGKINIFNDDGSFKSTYEIMDNIADIYYDLTDTNKADLLETIAGKNRANDIASLISNWENVKKAMDAATNAEGTAAEEQEKWIQSLQGYLEKLGAAWETLSKSFLSSEFLKGLIDGLTSFVNIIDVVIDKFGVMPVLIGAISMALSFKGIGFVKLNTDADGFLNRLTLMNTSLGTIGRSIATMFSNLSNAFKTGGLKGGFSAIGGGIKNGAGNMLTNMFVPQKDLAAIKAYNSEFDRLSEKVNQSGVSVSKYTIAQKAANNTMKNASVSAQAIVKGANGGKVAIESLGTSMLVAKAKTIALQVATTALNMTISMGLSIAISTIVSAITSWINKEEELKQKTLEVGESSKKEAKDIIELYNAYNQANSAYKSNTGSKEDLQSATDSLREALGLEQSELEKLIKKYGDVDNAIQEVTNDTLKKKLSDLKNGYLVAKKDLENVVKRDVTQSIFNPFYTDPNIIDFDLTKDMDASNVLKNAGFIDEINSMYRFQFDISSSEDAIAMYQSLLNMKEALENETGAGKQWSSIDELGEQSELYNKIIEKINTMSEKYSTVFDYINDINEVATQIEYNNFVSKNGIPETVNDFLLLRKSLIETAKSSGNFTGSQEQINKSITNALSNIPELSNLIDEYNNSLEQTEEVTTGIQYVTEALDTLSEKSVNATSSISKLNEVLNAQATGHSISLEDYNSKELADYKSALEYVNGSMQINADKAREIARAKVEEQTATNNANKELRQAQYMQNINQIEELNREIKTNTDLTKADIQEKQNKISILEELNTGYLSECNQLDILNASLRESVSAYNEWKAAQNSSESGDMFDDTLTAIKTINDTLNDAESKNYGKVGRKDFEASVGLIIPNSVDSEDEQSINSYLDSIRNLFTFNADGDIDGLNIEEFCQEAVDKGLMVLDEASDSYQVAGGKTMSDFANGMNLSMPLVQAMFGELEEFGAEFDWGDEMFSTFGDGIVAAQIEISDLETKIQNLEDQKNAGIDIDISQVDEAKTKLEELKKKKEELTEKATVNIETNMELDQKLSDAESELEGWKAKLDSGNFNGKTKVEVEAEIESAQEKITKIHNEKDKLQEPTQVEIQASLGSIDAEIASLQTKVDNFSNKEYYAKFGLSDEDAQAKVDSIQGKIDSLNQKKTKIEAYAETKQANSDLDSLDKKDVKDKEFDITANISQAETAINRINNALSGIHDKNVTITTTEKSVKTTTTTGDQKVNGTAHMSGTAKASGDWGNKEAGKTLVGELGREIVVNPHTGKWYTVGDNGAEFVDIPKNAIVFNHLQTEDLLSKGFVASRALALASGTALVSGTVSGNAMVTGGIKRKHVVSYTQGKDNSSNSTINPSTQSIKDNTAAYEDNTIAKEENANANKEVSDSEPTPEDFDWIERKIKWFQNAINNLKKSGEYLWDSWTNRTRNLNTAISLTQEEIDIQQAAIQRYGQQAESVGLDDYWKNLVQNGTIDISTISDDNLKEKIKNYQTWWDKIVECHNALQDLQNDLRELSIDNFNNIVTKYSKKIAYRDSVQERHDKSYDYKNRNNILNEKTIRNYYSKFSLVTSKNADDSIDKAKELQNQLDLMVKSGLVKKNSDQWHDLKIEIEEAKNSAAEYNRQILQNARDEVAAIKQVRETIRDKKLDSTDTYLSIGTSGITYSSSIKNSQLNFSNLKLNTKNDAYNKIVSDTRSSLDKYGKQSTKKIDKLLNIKDVNKNQKYKNALLNAKKAIKSKKKISSADMAVIRNNAPKTIYAKLLSYNIEIANLETAILERDVEYASNSAEKFSNILQKYKNNTEIKQNKINLLQSQLDNTTSVNGMNSKLNKITNYHNWIVANDLNEIKEYDKFVKSNRKTIKKKSGIGKNFKNIDNKHQRDVKNIIDAAKNAAKNGKPISASILAKLAQYNSKGYVTDEFYESCIDYNNALENKKQAEAQLEIDKQTAIEQRKTNTKQKFNNIRDKYGNERDKLNTKTSIGTNGFSYTTTSQNSQLNFKNSQLKKQNTSYNNAVKDSVNEQINIKKSNNSAINKELKLSSVNKNQKYKNALLNAKKAIKSKKKISSADLLIIKKNNFTLWNNLMAWNQSFEEIEMTKLEKDTNYASTSTEIFDNIAQKYSNKDNKTENKINLFHLKSNNATSLKSKNLFLDNIARQYDKIVANDLNEIKEYDKFVKSNRKTIKKKSGIGKNFKNIDNKHQRDVKNIIDAAKNAAKNGKPISASILAKLAQYNSKGYVTDEFYESCIDYNNALENKKQAEAQLEIDKQTAIEQKAAIGTEKFRNIEKKYDNKFNKMDSQRRQTKAKQDIKSAKGISFITADYQTLISYSLSEQETYTNEIAALNKIIQDNLDNGYWTTRSQEYFDALQSISNYQIKIFECKKEQIELNNAIIDLPYQQYEKALELLDAIANYHKSISVLKSAQGLDLSAEDYTQQLSDNNDKIHKYELERLQAYNDYLLALADTDEVYGGKTADEWLTKYNNLCTSINNIYVENENLKDALRDDVYWRNFERAHSIAQNLIDILKSIADLIDDSMIISPNGKFTDFGVAQIANIVKQFEIARKEVQNYTNDIQNLNSLYAQGFYNQDEFNEKLNELQNGLFDSASAMKSYISEIIDMNKKLAQSELDALFKLIDARNDALTAKKNYYDYDKTIKDKTKDIQALQAQIGALEGVETAEAKAQKVRLEADLADKKDDLNDTIMNHSFELSKDALNELKTILQDEFDERWDNIGQNLDEIQKLITAANELTAAQSHTVENALNKLLSFYGINPTYTDLDQFGNVTGYASGTRKVDKDKVAWTQENGQEVIVRKSDGAILTPFSRGDSVISNDLTNNLFDWGMKNPQKFADSLIRGIPNIPKVQSPITTVEQHYDSLLNVEGNVDSTVVTDLEKFAKTFYQGAYKYTINEIARDARKNGIKT